MNDRTRNDRDRSEPGRHGLRSDSGEPQYSSADDETYGSEWSSDADAPPARRLAHPPEGIGQEPGAGTGFDPGYGQPAVERRLDGGHEGSSQDGEKAAQ